MKFGELSIQNFMGFGSQQTLDLCNRGLVGVFGTIENSQSADSNGAGKSSILEAIVWVLWGKTLRNIKADEVINRGVGKDCFVDLEVIDGTTSYRIYRTRKMSKTKKPNDVRVYMEDSEITAGNVSDTQHLINGIVGIDFNTFSKSVVVSNDSSFCSLSDSARKEILENILQIDVFARARDLAKQKLNETEQKLSVLMAQYDSIKERRDRAYYQRKKLKADFERFEDGKIDKSIDLIKKRIKVVQEEEDNWREVEEYKAFYARSLKKESEKEILKEHIKDIDNKLKTMDKKAEGFRSKFNWELWSEKKSIDDIDQQISHICSMAAVDCPTCFRVVDPEYVDSLLPSLEASKEEHLVEIEKYQKLLNSLEDIYEEDSAPLLEEKRGYEKDLLQTSKACEDLKSHIMEKKNVLRSLAYLDREESSLRKDWVTLKKEGNPYSELFEECEKEISDLETALMKQEVEKKSLEMEVKHLRFWYNGFGNKGLKSLYMDNIIPFLNKQVQKYADIMSQKTLNIKFNTQKELKSGGVTDNFTIEVENLAGSDTYQGSSGGEKRRIDIAVNLALADLAATRAYKPIKFKALDEPFENLDQTGIDYVFRLLNGVVDNFGTVVCITHNRELKNRFQRSWQVVKEGKFSKVYQD